MTNPSNPSMNSPYTDRKGRTFEIDPSGRYPFRMVQGGKWTPIVSNGQGSKAIRDNEGLAACANVPPPAIRRSLEQLPPGADAWEYKILSSTFGASLESTLNVVGLQGWEVVSISAASGTWTVTGNKIFALLKRRLPRPHD